MTPASRTGFVVRILHRVSGLPAGLGFVVGERHVVTCAHTVNVALGRDRYEQAEPGAGVEIDFPLLDGGGGASSLPCRVEAWVPPQPSGMPGGDVAGLLVKGDGLPAGAGPAALIGNVTWGDQADLFGCPPCGQFRQQHGAWTSAWIRGPVGGGLLQLDIREEAAVTVQPGYSGSPVIVRDEADDAVAGMLSVASQNGTDKDAYAIPVSQIAKAWPGVVSTWITAPCPYRGLASFTADDEAVFVGRGDEIGELRNMVEQQPLVVVTGSSGVGKSSLVNAGLIPALRREGWLIPERAVFRPGSDPLEALAAALLAIEQPGSVATPSMLATWVSRIRRGQLGSIGSHLALLKGKQVLLHIDQLEDIFDQDSCPEKLTNYFVELLLSVGPLKGHGLHMVCTLRSDFYPQLQDHPDAGPRLRGRHFELSPMGKGRLERVITKPAELRGVHYENGLAQLIASHADSAGGLPLLEFALTKLWPLRTHRQINLEAYKTIDGVSGALTAHADDVYQQERERFGEERIRRVILALVRSRSGAESATRRVVTREWLGTDWEVAEALAQRRLVVLGRDPSKDIETAELAHEALIREWLRLKMWVDDDAEFQRWLTTLEERSSANELLPDSRIAEADRWLTVRSADIPGAVKHLIEVSKSEWQRRIAELEEARRRAEQAARQAETRRLAAAAELALVSRGVPPEVPIVLAIESLRTAPGFEGDLALRHALRFAPSQHSCINHDDQVWAVAFSPDGARLATAGEDGSARVFDLCTGVELSCLRHGRRVNAVVFSPDGSYLATTSADGSMRLFEVATGAELTRIDHVARVSAVAFSPDGSRLATASNDRSARVFDAATGAELARLNHREAVNAVAFSPDGARVATAGGVFAANDGGSARVFDAATGAELARFDDGEAVNAVAFSPDGARVAIGSGSFAGGSAWVLDAATLTKATRLDYEHAVRAVAFSPDGTRIATAGMDRTARVFDPFTGTQLARFDKGKPVNVAFSPDGTRIATAGMDGTARVFDATASAELACLPHSEAVVRVAFSPDGCSVATASMDHSARVFDAATGAEVACFRHGDWVQAAVFSPDGCSVATASVDHSARIFAVSTGAELARLEHGGPVNAVVFSPDGVRVATASEDHSARIFAVSTGAELARLEHGGPVNAVVFSPDGVSVATASEDRCARVLDLVTGAELSCLRHGKQVNAVVFSPDGARVATASDDRSARVFDVATGAELARLEHGGPVNAVVFSPDGARVATASDDRSARMFDPATGTELARIDHARIDHDGGVSALAFSPDGTCLATASSDTSSGSTRLFDATSHTEFARLDHDKPVNAVAFSPDGTCIATGSEDGRARLWIVARELLIKQAEERLTRNLTQQEWRRYFGDEPYRKTRADLP